MTRVTVHPLDYCDLWPMGFAFTEVGNLRRKLPQLGEAAGDKGPWIAGGAVRRMVCGEKLGKDVDFFFSSVIRPP